MSEERYTCAVCGCESNVRAEVVEFRDPVKLPRVIEKAKGRGRTIKPEDVRHVCLKCSAEMYSEEVKPPRSTRVTCPRCGEVIEVWL